MSRRSRLGIAPQEIDAQRVEIIRQTGNQLTRGARLELLFVPQDLKGRSEERSAAGERLVEHRADAVPVAGRGDWPFGRLLRGHVGGGAKHLRRRALVQPRRPQLGGQAQVQDHRATLPGHHHIRGLQVPMEPARLVEEHNSLGQLPQGGSQSNQGGRGEGHSRPRFRGGHRPVSRPVRGLGFPGEFRGRKPSPVKGGVEWSGAYARLLDRRIAPRSDEAQEIDPLDQLHREEPARAVRGQLVEAHQVGMGQVGQGAELALEAEDCLRIDPPQGLQGHRRATLLVEGPVNDPHAAAAQFALDAIVTHPHGAIAGARRDILEEAARGVVGVQERFDFAAQMCVGAAGLVEVGGPAIGGSLTAAWKMPLSDMGRSPAAGALPAPVSSDQPAGRSIPGGLSRSLRSTAGKRSRMRRACSGQRAAYSAGVGRSPRRRRAFRSAASSSRSSAGRSGSATSPR